VQRKGTSVPEASFMKLWEGEEPLSFLVLADKKTGVQCFTKAQGREKNFANFRTSLILVHDKARADQKVSFVLS
jgi:hypothetical protein